MATTKIGFHRPHDRKRTWYTGHVVDHKTGELVSPPSRTKQSFVAECDINNILKQFGKTGILRHVSARAAQGAYVDLPDDSDFQTAMNTVIRGEEAFASLPSSIRSRFGNDPANFLAFLADPANQDEVIKMGLAKDNRPPKPPPPPAGVAAAGAEDPKKPPTGGAGGTPPA